MDRREGDKYYEQMITLTGYPEWKVLVEELKKEIYQTQANLLQNSKSWDEVCVAKGWSASLAYVINLRENTIAAQANALVEEAANADV